MFIDFKERELLFLSMNNSSMIKVNTENTVSLNLVSLYTTTLALQKVMNGLFRMTLKIENRIEHTYTGSLLL